MTCKIYEENSIQNPFYPFRVSVRESEHKEDVIQL